MGVAHGRLHLRMTEKLANHRQAKPLFHGVRGISVPKIVNADIIETGCFADSPPWPLQIGDMTPRDVASDDKWVFGVARQTRDDSARRRRQRNAPFAGLRIW